MTNATVLTQQGKLEEATREIQEALAQSSSRSQTVPSSDSYYSPPFSSPAGNLLNGRTVQGQVRQREKDYAPRQHAYEQTASASLHDGAEEIGVQTDQQTGFLTGQFTHAGLSIPYRLFIPTTEAQRPVPLLVLLHGCTQDATDFATGTAMNAIAQENGMAVLYPSQSARANVNKCWNWFEPAHQRRDMGEPAALSALTRQICSDHACDLQQVFVAGMSAGGAMAVILGEQYPELFAAVGVHSGLPTGVASNVMQAMSAMKGSTDSMMRQSHMADVTSSDSGAPPRCQPFIIFHGDKDDTVNAANAQLIVTNCLMRAGSAEEIVTTEFSPPAAKADSVTVTIHTDNTRKVVCEYWQLHAAGHRWSGGNPAGSHTDAAGPDASAEMIRFFLNTARCEG